jgi:hypothetical protein
MNAPQGVEMMKAEISFVRQLPDARTGQLVVRFNAHCADVPRSYLCLIPPDDTLVSCLVC